MCIRDRVIWIMDESKLVKRLGTFPFPAEVLPFGSAWAAEAVKELGGTAVCRQRDGRPFVTDNGNWILDISFSENIDFLAAAKAVRGIPGCLLYTSTIGRTNTVDPWKTGRVSRLKPSAPSAVRSLRTCRFS